MRDFLKELAGQLTDRDLPALSSRPDLDLDSVSDELIEQVLQKLVALRYLDEERMAAAIIRDTFSGLGIATRRSG